MWLSNREVIFRMIKRRILRKHLFGNTISRLFPCSLTVFPVRLWIWEHWPRGILIFAQVLWRSNYCRWVELEQKEKKHKLYNWNSIFCSNSNNEDNKLYIEMFLVNNPTWEWCNFNYTYRFYSSKIKYNVDREARIYSTNVNVLYENRKYTND